MAYFNVSTLCGRQSLSPWDDERQGMGQCFQTVAIVCPAHFLLALTSAYVLGLRTSSHYLRSRTHKLVLYARILATLALAVAPLVALVFLYSLPTDVKADAGLAEIIETVVKLLSWLLHFLYNVLLLDRVSASLRGAKPVLVAWSLVVLADVVQCRSIWFLDESLDSAEADVFFFYAVFQVAALAVYLLTLCPAGDERESHYQELHVSATNEGAPLAPHRSPPGYGGFAEAADPQYMGVAKEFAPFLSRLFVYWVNPLIRRGRYGGLNSPDDVFDLPVDMSAGVAGENFQLAKAAHSAPNADVPLLKILFKTFGRAFFSIGLLKFLADCAGFASPLLLNQVVSFMEDKHEDVTRGYLCAAGLAASTFFVAMFTVHFNLFMGELGLKVRASVITAVYRHTLSVSSCDLDAFSSGEIINFMSTDIGRIVNFCPSLHAAWSLPFQFVVTVVLLYQQIGLSCLAGVGVTLLLIPLNKLVADAIGKMSTKMMAAKDQRVKVMSEVLHGARVIKYFTWEEHFTSKVNEHRQEELKYLKGRKYLDAICVFLWATTPVLISVLTFTMYVLLGNRLTAAKVFTSVALFAMMTGPLNALPWVINGLVESMVSIRRIRSYFSLVSVSREQMYLPMRQVSDAADPEEDVAICLAKGRFALSSSPSQASSFALSELNLSVERGQFVGVVGRVGSGKSSLLSALLGELRQTGGEMAVRNPAASVGYVAQEPWLQQGTVRDNILFGKSYRHGWYEQVVDACALRQDLDAMERGDATQVGEHGSMLSGGQRARVALARAVYQDSDVYLVDDVFSAVDATVGSHIYQRCVLGLLRNKTVVLCSHHPRYLSAADQVVVMAGGRVVETGLPREVLGRSDLRDSFRRGNSFRRGKRKTRRPGGLESSGSSSSDSETADNANADEKDDGDEEEESREEGAVKYNIYKNYWLSIGKLLSPAILVSLTLMQFTKNFTDVWLAEWVTRESNHSRNATVNTNASSPHGADFYLTVYGSIAGANALFSLIRAFLFAYGGICAARAIHVKLLRVVLYAKSYFFDLTSSGRILNRFSSDLCTVDDSLPFILNIFLAQLFGVLGPLLVCVYSVPWLVLVLIPLTFAYFDLQQRYRPSARDLKRLSSVSLSPIYSQFNETLSGLKTIRAMRASSRFVRDNEDRVEANQKTQYAGIAAQQWLELRLQLIGCAVVAGVSLIAVVEHHTSSIDPGYVGLAVSYALGITGKLSGLLSAFAETEKELVAVERCYQYIDEVPQEQLESGTVCTPYDWPSEGIVTFRDVSLRYRDHLPWALHGVSLETKGGEKVGVVGRTGAGKSSLFHALFRLSELGRGEICIDNANIRALDLRELRRNLAIIPQQPFLFSGTVRENLDPLGVVGDREMWDSLKKTRLDQEVARMGGLDAAVEERGKTFSVGQRQLFCLARAILSPAKIVCVDEATANVDSETDQLVQEVLQTALRSRTVLTVAHRVNTVLGSSQKVVVMAGGRVTEVGHPNMLLQDPESQFSKHVAEHS